MNETPGLALRWIVALLGGGLIALGSSLHPVWWAAWLGPAAVLWAAFASRAWAGAGLAFVAGLLGGVPLALFLHQVATLPLLIGVSAISAATFAAGVALAAAARRLGSPAVAVFAFPAWCAALDAVRSWTSPHGTSSSIAYSQMDVTPVLQVAALGGTPAVTFVVTLFASGLAFALADARSLPRARAAAVPTLAVVAAALGFGAWRLATAPAVPRVTVALAALDLPHSLPADWRGVLDTYRPRLDEAASRGARLVVLPEEIARVPDDQWGAARERMSTLSRATGAPLVAGFRVGADGPARNRLLVADPGGRVAQYDKRHLIPGLESSEVTASDNPVLVVADGGLRLGGAICKDFDFVDTGRGLAAGGAQVVAGPAWDFGVDAWIHGRMAVLRAVEGGFTLVRSARGGNMTVSDRLGRVLAEGPSGPTAPLLVAQAPVPDAPPTLYARIGDVFGAACLVLVGVLLLALSLRAVAAARTRGGPAESTTA